MEQKPGRFNHLLEGKQQGKKKRCEDDSRVLLQFLPFSFFIWFYNALPFLKQEKKSSWNTALQEDPNEAFQPYQSVHSPFSPPLFFSLFFFSYFFSPQNEFCPKGNTSKWNTLLWMKWPFPLKHCSSRRRLRSLAGCLAGYQCPHHWEGDSNTTTALSHWVRITCDSTMSSQAVRC